MKKKNLYIITMSFPYGTGEQFFKYEVDELSKYFDTIYLFPLFKRGEKRELPTNVQVNNSLINVSRKIPKSFFLINIFFVIKILLEELFHSNKKNKVIKQFRTTANSILQAKVLSKVFLENVDMKEINCFYSFWMNEGALILSILKSNKIIPDFSFRVNGFDLFDKRRKDNYIPLRYFNFKQAKNIIVLSKAGYEYLKRKTIYPEKLFINYYGINNSDINPLDTSTFTIVSCSNIVQLKRVDKIIGALKYISFTVKWIHFGDGILMEEMKKAALELPSNIEYFFKGNVTNDVIFATYKRDSINLFLHLSESEGLGFAIIEAQSFGIPALAVNTGGVNDVVNEQTGILITSETPLEEIAKRIIAFKNNEMNTTAFRENVKVEWKKKFSTEINYRSLFLKITE